MKTLIVIAAFTPQPLWKRPLGNKTLDLWVEGAARQALPEAEIFWLGPKDAQGVPPDWLKGRTWVAVEDGGVETVVERLSSGFDELVWLWVDEPLVRPELIRRLVELHRDYRAEYTFADGFPQGLTPEVLDPKIVPTLRSFAQKEGLNRTRPWWFSLVSQDINAFDVETELSPVDLRMERLSFRADSLRNFVLMERWQERSLGDLKRFLEELRDNPVQRRTLPATLQVQISAGVRQVPLWSPLLQFRPEALSSREFLDLDVFSSWVTTAAEWAGGLTVMPSLWCEPSLHPDFLTLARRAWAVSGVRLVVETSGLGWNEEVLTSLSHEAAGRLDWIVELDSNVESTYTKIRGEGFAEAQATTLRLIELFPGHVWPQTVRMNETEEETESFYRFWKEKAGQAIILKYNFFGGVLPQRKPADLSPWKRHPCWHLQRDLAVFLDGKVVPCRDALDRHLILGQAGVDTWEAIWKAGEAAFARHAQQDYPEVCRLCDEYYTFFF
jgi:spiro-SPASM protein